MVLPPEVVTRLIASYELTPLDAPEKVWRYEYRGDVVYYVPPRCCDIPSTLYDSKGTIMCSPDGGITGAGDGLCPTFFKDRKKGVVIWTNRYGN